jgi:hypothetical protein
MTRSVNGRMRLVLLDARDERRREQAAVDGVLPAHERLEAAEPARRDLDLRLEVQLELAARDAGAQLAERARRSRLWSSRSSR